MKRRLKNPYKRIDLRREVEFGVKFLPDILLVSQRDISKQWRNEKKNISNIEKQFQLGFFQAIFTKTCYFKESLSFPTFKNTDKNIQNTLFQCSFRRFFSPLQVFSHKGPLSQQNSHCERSSFFQELSNE